MNKLNFKTYEEFVEDKKYEILDDFSDDEKLDLYNQYCEYNNDPDSIIYPNDDEFLETMFSNFNDVARAVYYGDYKYTDEYIKFNAYGNLQTYYDSYDALQDNFVDSEMVDFILENEDTDFNDLYIDYIDNILNEAKESMSKEEFSNTLKEYMTDEMIDKYPDVYNTIDYSYYDYILDEKDTDKFKEIDDDFER